MSATTLHVEMPLTGALQWGFGLSEADACALAALYAAYPGELSSRQLVTRAFGPGLTPHFAANHVYRLRRRLGVDAIGSHLGARGGYWLSEHGYRAISALVAPCSREEATG